MQRLSLTLMLALSFGIQASSALAADRQPANPLRQDRFDLIVQLNKAADSVFVSVEHPTQGQAEIIEVDGQKYLEFSQDFQSDRGPALEVILHQNSSVDLKVQPGSYVSLGELQAFSGTQRYLIPNDLDLAAYQSVAIWCEKFNATFGYAPLAQ